MERSTCAPLGAPPTLRAVSSTRFPSLSSIALQVTVSVAAALIAAWLWQRFAPGSRPAN